MNPTALEQPGPTAELLEGPPGKPMSYWQLVWWRLRRDKVTLAAAAVILLIVLSAVLAAYLAPYDPFQGSIRKRLAMVGTPGHVLGTDEQGRDMLTRLLYGGRWPSPMKIGQQPLDEAMRKTLEQAYPEVTFDWAALQRTLQQALATPRAPMTP